MAGNKRECGLHGPIAMRGMQVGVAYAAGFGFDDDLARPGRRDVQFPKLQRLPELLDYRGVHLGCHE
jgi:hypothetical protein